MITSGNADSPWAASASDCSKRIALAPGCSERFQVLAELINYQYDRLDGAQSTNYVADFTHTQIA